MVHLNIIELDNGIISSIITVVINDINKLKYEARAEQIFLTKIVKHEGVLTEDVAESFLNDRHYINNRGNEILLIYSDVVIN
jgi:hypothetical protein